MDLLDTTLIGYTRIGYERRIDPDRTPLPRMDGRRVVLTGATSGLGEAAAHRLSGLGADLVLVGRSREKLERTRSAILAEKPSARVELEVADLSLLAEIRALAARLSSRAEPIHVLVNNAGVLINERRETKEGHEVTFATNLLGHYLLTELLRSRLVASAPSRVINVSSGGMYSARIRVDDLETRALRYDGPSCYARTKRGQVILTELWADELRDRGVVVHSMHPGWADTPAVRESLPNFFRVTKPFLRTPAQGADTIVWLAAADEPSKTTGLFWHDRAPRPTHRSPLTRESAEDRKALREALRRMAGVE
ncbi:MAG: SDR family NAD(P)-dependent oxidoreductase [Polyangiales bacterium]